MCSPHSAADIQSHMEKYLVDAPPSALRQSRPADYRRETAAAERDEDDSDDERGDHGRVTPAIHAHDLALLRTPAGTGLSDVKPLCGLNSDGKTVCLQSLIIRGHGGERCMWSEHMKISV